MEATNKTGWELNHRTHFDEIVINYDKIRPEYPCELFNDIFSYSGTGKNKTALEIGAGTGKATTPFLNAGYNVTAVELGKNMADFLQKKYINHNGFNVIISDFENAQLENDYYDLVYAATAFHWVDPQIGCPKVYRVLKNNGIFALFRYNVIPHIGEPHYEDIQAVYEKYYSGYYTASKKPVKKTRNDFCTPVEIKHSFGFEDLKDYGFNNISMKFYDISRTFTTDEFIAIRDTCSDHRALPESNRNALYDGLREVMLKHGGRYKEDYIFQLYMGMKI
jgi:ubiquinone/menaquinone biosynthesis C-methylase UbiE